jgi:hypothetical protein
MPTGSIHSKVRYGVAFIAAATVLGAVMLPATALSHGLALASADSQDRVALGSATYRPATGTDAEGNLYAATSTNGGANAQIRYFGLDGTIIQLTTPSSSWWPDYVTIDARSTTDVFYTDQASNPFGCAGALWHFDGSRTQAIGPSGTCKPTSVVIGSDNLIYFKDTRQDAYVDAGSEKFYRSTNARGSDWTLISKSEWSSQWRLQHPDDQPQTAVAPGGLISYTYEGNTIFRTVTGPPAPRSPGAFDADVVGNSVAFSWNAVSGVDSYRVTVNPGSLSCTSLGTSCSINGLEWGTDFTATVVAIGSTGTSAPSAAVSFSTEYRPDAPSRVTVQQSGTIAAVSWSAVTGADSYVVRVSPGNASCESVQRTCTVSGLTRGDRYAVQVFTVDSSIESEGSTAVSFVAGDTPGVVSGVGVVPGAGTAVVSWTAPTDPGDSVVTGYRVESAPGGRECVAVAPDTSCEVEGLTNGVPYLFEVFASNAVGEGEGVVSEEAIAFTWPGTPGNVRVGLRLASSAELRWDAAASNGSAITGYVLNVSRDDGATWTESEIGVVTKANVPGLTSSAQAAWVEVAAVNARGQSAFSAPVLVTTTGVKSSVRVAVVDAAGEPVIGGAITWAMSNGAASSSKTYGLTDDGIIDFPLAPAGAVNVTVTGALTADGATVSGIFNGHLGFTSTVLQLPEVAIAARTVTVELPNGLPVPGVAVGLNPDEGQYQDSDCLEWAYGDLGANDFCLDDSYGPPSRTGGFAFSKTVQGFTFTVPKVAQTLTDANGKVVLSGFTNGQPRVDVSYDDGIITQAKSVVLRNTDTVVQLDYMPWVEVSADSLAAGLGAAVTIPVSVETGDAEIASRSRLARANQGIKVTVLPPAGAGKGTCKAKLTAATNLAGKASLTVCATKSGMYRFKTEGAAAVDGVLLKVKGAAPMSPTAVTVRSLSVGTAKASWNPPAYAGGSPIINYVITATAKGKSTVIKTVAGTVKSISLTGLANATKYTVKIQAKTVKGLSDPYTVIVPVA